MFSTDGILGRNFAIASAALNGLALRQQLHSENIANIDTEGYRAKTVNFEKVLSAALRSEDPGSMFRNPMGRSAGVGDALQAGNIASSFAVEHRGRGGVSRTQEVSAMMNDNIRFRVLSQQVTNQISALRSVIAEMGRG